MKKITVSDILRLDIFRGYRLAAGENGLTNQVHYINVYDNPVSEVDYEIQMFPGDVYLTFFYYGKDDPDYILNTLNYIIEQKGSAVIVFDEYLQDLPQEALLLCDNASLPVIFLDCHTPYSLVISAIMECRIAMEHKNAFEEKLETILHRSTAPDYRHQLLEELNPAFQQNIIALFILLEPSFSQDDIIRLSFEIIRDIRNFAAEFRDGLLILLSYPDSREAQTEHTISHTLQRIHAVFPSAYTGISNAHHLNDADAAISESILAAHTGLADSTGRIDYRRLGIVRLLAGLLGSPVLEQFYSDMTLPVLTADQENGTSLFDTMLTFAACGMDYKKTAASMFVHENTIRYRISRIRDLIPYGKTEMDFYETISVTAKIHRMKHL